MVSSFDGRLHLLTQPPLNGGTALYAVVVTMCPVEDADDDFDPYDVVYLCESLEIARGRFSERLSSLTEGERERLRDEGATPEVIADWTWTFQDTPDLIWAATPDGCIKIQIWKVTMETDAMEIKD